MADAGLRQIFSKNLPHYHWQAIESGFTGRGIPDSNYCCANMEGWIENKKTHGWKVGISPEQVGWHLRRHRAGGRTFIAVRRLNYTKTEGDVDQLWLYCGKNIESLRDFGIVKGPKPAIHCHGGPAKWDWGVISAILLGAITF